MCHPEQQTPPDMFILHLRRVWHADRVRLLLQIPDPFRFGLAFIYVLLVETNAFPELIVIFPDYALRTPLGTLLILLVSDHTLLFGIEKNLLAMHIFTD